MLGNSINDNVNYNRCKEYWKNILSISSLDFKFLSDAKVTGEITKEKEVKLDNETSQKVLTICKNNDLSVFILLLSALNVLVYKCFGKETVTIKTPLIKEKSSDDPQCGYVLVSNQLNKKDFFKKIVLELRKGVIDAYEHQGFNIDGLIHGNEDKTNSISFSDVLCQYDRIHNDEQIEDYNINFSFRREENNIYLTIFHKYDTETAYYLNEYISVYITILENAIQDLNLEIENLAYVNDDIKRKVLYDFNQTLTNHKFEDIYSLFAKQVEITPDAVVIVKDDLQITYSMLKEQISILSKFLKNKGVQSSQIIPVIIDKSVDMLTCIFSILKLGAAYLPIDPKMPFKRITEILNDTASDILLSNYSTIRKISYAELKTKRINQNIFVAQSREIIGDLNDIPITDRSSIDYSIYNKHVGYSMVKHSISLETTRGCPYSCIFCHKLFKRGHRRRSAQDIFEEVYYYYKLGVKRFSIVDDIFNLDKKNSEQFFKLILEKKLKVNLFFTAGLRGDILTEDYIDLMVEAGTVSMAPALETASERLQKVIKKNLNIDKLYNNLIYISQKYPHVNLELFTMHGFPTETEKDAESTLDFIKSIKWLHFPYINILRIYSKTEMEKFALENGIKKYDILRSESLAYHEIPYTLPFDKSFTIQYQLRFLNEYFLHKERLLHVLPYQMKILTEDELIQKYNTYLPQSIKSFDDILDLANIQPEELKGAEFVDEKVFSVPDLNVKLDQITNNYQPKQNALKILLIDLDLYFSENNIVQYDLIDEPLGLMGLLTFLKNEFTNNIQGKVIKSRLNFDNYFELLKLIRDFNPHLIGIRSLTYYKEFVHTTIGVIRQNQIDIPIIVGGPHATSNYNDVLQDNNINAVVIGEGELTLNELVRYMIANENKFPDEKVLKDIKGIAFAPKEKQLSSDFRNIFLVDNILGFDEEAEYEEESKVEENNPAYVIYTSGTTSKPKGVVINQKNLSNYLIAFKSTVEITDKTVIAQLNSISFDACIEEILPVLTSGGRVVLPDYYSIINFNLFPDFCNKYQITNLDTTPLLLNEINKVNIPATVKCIISGGDTLNYNFVNNLISHSKIYNSYGPTEITICATYQQVSNSFNNKRIPIGKPLANYKVYILDENYNPCPIGVVGQICVSGDGLTKGYLNSPELTSEKFIPNPFVKDSVLYKTGDLGKWLYDGSVDFAGRFDNQVKIRGFRVGLEEIEERALKSNLISHSVVLYHSGNLLLFYVRKSDFNEEALGEYLKTYLPDYMLPGNFIEVKSIPKKPNGKTDISLLLKFASQSNKARKVPKSGIEEQLCKIWSDILDIQVEQIGSDSNFFQLGGHSLKATILIAQIYKKLSVKLSLASIFEAPTIEDFALLIDQQKTDHYNHIVPLSRADFYDISFAQEMIWSICGDDIMNLTYNITGSYVMINIDTDILYKCLWKLVERHEMLRTSFVIVNNKLKQVVNNVPDEIDYQLIDIRQSDYQQSDIKQIIEKENTTGFDLEKDQLFRVKLVHIDDSKYLIFFSIHHIIADAWSFKILIDEILQFYLAERNGTECSLAPLKVQYKEFANWHNNQILGDESERFKAFWKDYLNIRISPLNLPLDNPREQKVHFSGKQYSFGFSADQVNFLNQLSVQNNSTVFSVLVTFLNILLYKYTNQKDIIIGIPSSLRSHIDFKDQIGYYLNMLPFLSQINEQEEFMSFFDRVKDNMVKAFSHQLYPLELITKLIDDKKDISNLGLFNVVSYLDFEDEVILLKQDDKELIIQEYPLDIQYSKFDIEFSFQMAGDKLTARWIYNSDIFNTNTIETMAERFLMLIDKIIENKDQNINDISLIKEISLPSIF